jgi:hypothetical protein
LSRRDSKASEDMGTNQDQEKSKQPKATKGHSLRRFGIFVLGAGFSRPAGLPLASELWAEVRRRAKSLSGRASKFNDDLEYYMAFRKECDGITLTPSQVDFEDFMAFLDVEYYLGLRGSDTWSEDGNEAQVVVKTLIAETLTEQTPPENKLPDVYLRFAEMLQPEDIVLTFNYDVVLERALEIVGKPFRLFPDRLKVVRPDGYAEVDSSREEVVVLKLHGSVDWFNRRAYRELEENRKAHGLPDGHAHPVFGPSRQLRISPVVDGPRHPTDPLREMYRVQDIELLYRSRPLFLATPWLLNPSVAKILYSRTLKDFWWGLGEAGVLNFKMAIIGFSLPPQDDYARQVLYRLVSNYQRNYWEEGVLDQKKSPLIVVDLRRTASQKRQFRRRYAFVDWDRAETYFDGLNEEVVGLLQRV